MKRHTNKALQITSTTIFDAVQDEMVAAAAEHGRFNSSHELYAVLLEELDEFWDSVKENDPDPFELIQVAATAVQGAIQLCNRGRQETDELITRNDTK
jgi:hypothetical protein